MMVLYVLNHCKSSTKIFGDFYRTKIGMENLYRNFPGPHPMSRIRDPFDNIENSLCLLYNQGNLA